MNQQEVLSLIVAVFGGTAVAIIATSLWALRVLRKRTESEKQAREACESKHKYQGLAHQR